MVETGNKPKARPGRKAGRKMLAAASVFLAYQREIAEMLNEGATRAEAYARYGALIGVSYPQFTRYVRRYLALYALNADGTKARKEPAAASSGSTEQAAPRQKPYSAKHSTAGNFFHDPEGYKREGLI